MFVRQAAKDYAKDNGVTLQHVMELIEEKRIEGFYVDGYWYVRFDSDIDQATALGQTVSEDIRPPAAQEFSVEQTPERAPDVPEIAPDLSGDEPTAAPSPSDHDGDAREYLSVSPSEPLTSVPINEPDPRSDSRAETDSPSSEQGKATLRKISLFGALLLVYGLGVVVLNLQHPPNSQDFFALGNEAGLFSISFPLALIMGGFLVMVSLGLRELNQKREAIEQCDEIHPRLSSIEADALVSWRRKQWIKGSVNNLFGLSIGFVLGSAIVHSLGVESWSYSEAMETDSALMMLAYAIGLLGAVFSIIGFVVQNGALILVRATVLFAMGIIAALIVYTSLHAVFELDVVIVPACLAILFLFWYAAYIAITRYGRVLMWRDIQQTSEEAELAAVEAAERCLEDPVSLKGMSLTLNEHKAFFKIPLLKKGYVCLMRTSSVVMIGQEINDLRILDRMDFEIAGLYGVPIEPANKIVRSDEWIQSIYWEFDDASLEVYRSWSSYRGTTS